jgi:hypothetical protein
MAPEHHVRRDWLGAVLCHRREDEVVVRFVRRRLPPRLQLFNDQFREWIRGLQALRGIAQISAVTIAAELGQISRFDAPRQLMGYSGAVPNEDSSGKRTQRGSITKTGNAHLRRIAVEASWSYRPRPAIGPVLRKRQEGVPEEIKEIAWKAQLRLHKRYSRLVASGKDQRKVITAVCRELLGFIWAIGSRRKRQPDSRWRPDKKQEQKQRQKQKRSQE